MKFPPFFGVGTTAPSRAVSKTRSIDRAGKRGVRLAAGFSLVEVTLAIGIVGFAFVSIFGLIPVGMTTFRRAMNTSVGSQIAQRVFNEAQQADSQPASGTIQNYYFDDQGYQLISSGQVPAGTAYYVKIKFSLPTLALGGTNISTLTTVVVQVASSPNAPIDSNNLWVDSPSVITRSGVVLTGT